MNKKLQIFIMFLILQTSNSYIITGSIDHAKETLETVNLIKKSYRLFCDVTLLYKEFEKINLIMFHVSRKNLNDPDLNEGLISKSVLDAFDIFINAMKKLHKITAGNYRILSHDHHGNIDISIKYTKPDGSSIWISAERYLETTNKEAEKGLNHMLSDKISLEERIARRDDYEARKKIWWFE